MLFHVILFHVLFLFSFSRHLNFCPDFFDHVEKQLDKKAKVKFKYCPISQEVKATRQRNLVS